MSRQVRDLARELERLRELFLTEQINTDEAIDRVYEVTCKYKPYNSQWWKNKRKQIILDKCEFCGEESGPFVLQHLWHPTYHLKFVPGKSSNAYRYLKSREIVTKHIEEYLRYLSFVDCKTYCRRCAYFFDLHQGLIHPTP